MAGTAETQLFGSLSTGCLMAACFHSCPSSGLLGVAGGLPTLSLPVVKATLEAERDIL